MSERLGIRSATIIIHNEKLLLVKSKYEGKEFYLFPGGGIEFGETIEECAIRETFEETGVKAKIIDLFHINEYIYQNDWNKRSVSFFFLAEPLEILKPLTNDNEKIKEVKWIDLNEIDKYEILPRVIVDLIKDSKKLKGLGLKYSVDFKK